MNKRNGFIFPIIFIIFSLIIVGTGLGLFNELPELLKDKLNEFEFPVDVGNEAADNTEAISMLINDIRSIPENCMSENINALWFDINKDLNADAASGTEAVKYAIYSDFLYFRNFIPNTIFIRPDIEKEFSALEENDGSQFDVLAYSLYYCRDIGCEAYLVVDETMAFDSFGRLSDDIVTYYLENYNFKGILLSVNDSYSQKAYYENALYFNKLVSEKFPDKFFGVEIHSDTEMLFADDFVIKVFEDNLVDFGYVDCMVTTADTEFPYLSVALWWNSFAEYYNVPIICEHRADLIFSNSTTWGYSDELVRQVKALYNCPAFDGSCFYRTSYIKNKQSLARDLSIFLNDVTASEQDTFDVENLKLANKTVTFNGTILNDTFNLYCNDKRIVTSEGAFSQKYNLTPGLNEFHFFSNGGQYSYDIISNSELIYRCYPDADVTLEADRVIEPYAICPSGSIVYILINGYIYQMPVADSSSFSDIPQGYEVFSSSITVNKSSIKLEDIAFLCSYNGIIDVIDAGMRTDTASTCLSASRISPYKNNGFGNSLMCILKNDNTEQISEVEDYDTYHPYNSSLLANTIDYVENINVSKGGYLRYELKSGINVYGTDAILIDNGYVMPNNTIHLLSCDNNGAGKTVMTFSKDWLSPITVTTQKLDYKKGYLQFSFNVESFAIDYVDITFHYTDELVLDNVPVFSDESVFSHYELYKDADKLIMRLYLKNKQAFFGYDLKENADGNIEISFKNNMFNGINGKVIMLDPGHGGISMVGTALKDNSASEANITLSIALKAKKHLEAMGAKVIMTRISDIGLDLPERTKMCEAADPDIFVSIHCDGSDTLTESGTHTFYFTPYSQPLASSIHSSLVNAYRSSIYVEADENFEKIDRKIKYYPFYVTRVDNCPSVLIETGFLTNFVEGNVLANPVNQEIIASAISNGISAYFN